MENHKFYNTKSRSVLIITLSVVLAVCLGFSIYLSVTPNSIASAAAGSYTTISNMPSNTNSGAAFTVDGKTVMGNTTSLTKYLATGGSIVVRENIVNMGAFGNYSLANLYYSSSASTNFVRCATGSGYKITQPGRYYFVTIVDCYSSPAHTSITKSYRSSSVLCIEVKSADLPVTPTKTGYTFTGWYTDSACTKPYEKDTITSDITLYAGFRANTYTIVFNGNGNTSGSMSNLSMTYDVAKNLTANAFVRTGYKFDGWATSSGGSVAYADKASVKNLTAEDGATINLYAHWTLVDYTVHFNGNGNTSGSMTNQTLTRDIAQALKSNAFAKTGYHFTGWATSADGAVVYQNAQSVTNIGTAGSTVELYAVWVANTFTIVYHSNLDDATGSMSNQVCTYDQTTTLKANAFTRTGYNFLGWATSADGEVEFYDSSDITNLTSTNGQTIHLYAVWEIVRCQVTFIVDGEVFVVVSVDYGTPSDEVVGKAVNGALYTVRGKLPNV